MSVANKKKKFIPIDVFLRKNIPCKNGHRCTRPDCGFLHNVKTRMCKFEDRCKRRNTCTFAHSKEELYVAECKFGFRCKNEKCTFKHPKAIQIVLEQVTVPNNPENLESKNFPAMKINVEPEAISSTEEPVKADYTKMKNKIKYLENFVIKCQGLETVLEEYDCVEKFGSIIFQFQDK